jgi:hypothetical protein
MIRGAGWFARLFLPTAALVGSTMTYAAHLEATSAERLVRAMRLDQFAVQGTLAAYLTRQSPNGELTDRQKMDFSRCMQSSDTSQVVSALASVLARQLLPNEIEQVLSFYESSAGSKQAQRELVETQKTLDHGLATVSPELSEPEKTSLARFKDTRAYAKLQDFPVKVREASEAREAIFRASEKAAESCAKAVGLAH